MAASERVAVVTGAGTGIGRQVALALLREGYAVGLAGRRLEPLNETAEMAGAAGSRALAVATDVSDPASVKALFARVSEAFGRLDVLQFVRVVAKKSEVMYRVAIDRRESDLFVIAKYGLGDHGARRHHMTIGEDQPLVRIDDEASRLRRGIPFRVERARRIHTYRHDAGRDTLQRVDPCTIFGSSCRHRERGREQNDE